VILCHARREPDLKGLTVRSTQLAATHWVLGCRTGWAAAYPQSAHLLREETAAWQKTPWTLEFNPA